MARLRLRASRVHAAMLAWRAMGLQPALGRRTNAGMQQAEEDRSPRAHAAKKRLALNQIVGKRRKLRLRNIS